MSVIEVARKQFRNGEPDEARRALLEAASGPNPNPHARRVYEELFPLTPKQREWMSAILMNLASKKPDARSKAASEVGRAARAEMSYEQQDKIGDPRCLDYLIPALESEDTKVVENVTPAVARAALFYCRDWRAWEPGPHLLKSKKPVIRRWAVAMLAYLGREEAIDSILPLFSDPGEVVRNEVGAMLLWMARSNYLSAESRKRLATELPRSLPGRDTETRSRMVGMVRLLNDKAGIEPLRAALKAEADESVRQYIGQAIRCLEAGDPNLPM
jgi:HEAT repeat protein